MATRYTVEERILLLEWYLKNNENVTLTLRNWSTTFKNRPKPSPTMLKKLVERFRKTGSVKDNTEDMKTNERTARTPDIVEQARQEKENNPTISTRRLALRLGISQPSAWRVLRQDLKEFPYKIQTAQRLTQQAVEKRLSFAADICQLVDDRELDINRIIFSDEAHFWLDGYVNRQNYRIWGTEKPEVLVTKPLHPQKVTVWCGLCSQFIIGPFFIEESIDGERYGDLLEDRIIPELEQEGATETYHFQQDGAPPHSTRANLTILRRAFGDRVIARNFPETFQSGMAWPPYSPDLSPLDFFLWGYVKDKVYREAPKTIPELRRKVEETIRNIGPEILHRTIQSFEKRCRYLIVADGGHIENIIH